MKVLHLNTPEKIYYGPSFSVNFRSASPTRRIILILTMFSWYQRTTPGRHGHGISFVMIRHPQGVQESELHCGSIQFLASWGLLSER